MTLAPWYGRHEQGVDAGRSGSRLPLKERVPEHVRTVVVQVGVLLRREVANAHAGVDSPCIQKLVSDLRDDDQFLAAGEGDVALIEQVIDVRRQQQAVGTIEALGISRVPPWLDVTRLPEGVGGWRDVRCDRLLHGFGGNPPSPVASDCFLACSACLAAARFTALGPLFFFFRRAAARSDLESLGAEGMPASIPPTRQAFERPLTQDCRKEGLQNCRK